MGPSPLALSFHVANPRCSAQRRCGELTNHLSARALESVLGFFESTRRCSSRETRLMRWSSGTAAGLTLKCAYLSSTLDRTKSCSHRGKGRRYWTVAAVEAEVGVGMEVDVG